MGSSDSNIELAYDSEPEVKKFKTVRGEKKEQEKRNPLKLVNLDVKEEKIKPAARSNLKRRIKVQLSDDEEPKVKAGKPRPKKTAPPNVLPEFKGDRLSRSISIKKTSYAESDSSDSGMDVPSKGPRMTVALTKTIKDQKDQRIDRDYGSKKNKLKESNNIENLLMKMPERSTKFSSTLQSIDMTPYFDEPEQEDDGMIACPVGIYVPLLLT